MRLVCDTMLKLAEQLGLPVCIIGALTLLLFISQVIGEFLTLKGRVVPVYLNIRKWLKDRAAEKRAIREIPAALEEVRGLLNVVNQHYSEDNITMRDEWMKNVNDKLHEHDDTFRILSEMMGKNNADTLEILVENKRNYLISFAAAVSNDDYLASREQFARFFKVYEEYETIIKENNKTNGEVDIAYRIVTEAWTERLTRHSFLEDIRGYI